MMCVLSLQALSFRVDTHVPPSRRVQMITKMKGYFKS